jgi:hypothetical protein
MAVKATTLRSLNKKYREQSEARLAGKRLPVRFILPPIPIFARSKPQ